MRPPCCDVHPGMRLYQEPKFRNAEFQGTEWPDQLSAASCQKIVIAARESRPIMGTRRSRRHGRTTKKYMPRTTAETPRTSWARATTTMYVGTLLTPVETRSRAPDS